MMRSQRAGERYLALLVLGAASIEAATFLAATALGWTHRPHVRALVELFCIGLLPAALAFRLGAQAWKARGTPSLALSATALVLLLAAIAASRFAAGAISR